MPESHDLIRVEAIEKAFEIIRKQNEIDRLTRIIANRLPELELVFEYGNDGMQISRQGGECLATDLRVAGFENWSHWLEVRDYRAHFSISPNHIALDLLMGRAAGFYFSLHPDSTRLSTVVRALRPFGDAWKSFASVAAMQIVGQTKLVSILTDFLNDQINYFTMAPGHMAIVQRTSTCKMVEAFWTNPKLQDIWHNRYLFGGVVVKNPAVFDILRQCNSSEFIRLLDLFPHPEPVRQIISYSANNMSASELLNLLSISPLAFDEGGQWIVKSKTPLLILSALMEKLEVFVHPCTETVENSLEKCKSTACAIIDVLISRPDAVWFGYSWLQQMISGWRHRGRRSNVEGNFSDEAHRFILVELAKALPVRPKAIEWVKGEDEILRRDRAVAAIAGSSLGKPRNHKIIATLIGDLLDQEILSDEFLEEAIENPSVPEHFLIGVSISTIPSSASWFSALRKKLMPIRDRSRHSLGDRIKPSSAVDKILISWSLCGLNFIPLDTEDARLLWLEIHMAIKESMLTQVESHPKLASRSQYRFLSALLAARLNRDPTDVTLHDLRDLLRELLFLDVRLADVILALRKMNVPLTTIINCAHNSTVLIDLLHRIAEEEADLHQLRKLPFQTGLSFHETIDALATELSTALPG